MNSLFTTILFFCLTFFTVINPLNAQTIPVYDFPDLQQVMNAQNDTTYVINFWATWCKPCVEEMPYFEQLHDKYAGDKVKVLLVSLDFRSQLEKRVIPFVEKRNLQPQVVLLDAGNPNDWIDLVDPSWSGAIPATLFIKKNKRKFVEDSFHDLFSLETIINTL